MSKTKLVAFMVKLLTEGKSVIFPLVYKEEVISEMGKNIPGFKFQEQAKGISIIIKPL